jgi:hypothetical protein
MMPDFRTLSGNALLRMAIMLSWASQAVSPQATHKQVRSIAAKLDEKALAFHTFSLTPDQPRRKARTSALRVWPCRE